LQIDDCDQLDTSKAHSKSRETLKQKAPIRNAKFDKQTGAGL